MLEDVSKRQYCHLIAVTMFQTKVKIIASAKHDVSNEKLPVIDLERKSKFGNLLDSLRVRSEGLPSYSRKHAYKIRRKNLIGAQPVKEK